MFIDQAEIQVVAGDGGNGAIAWRREKYVPKGGPAGGDGGRGGSVRLLVDPNTAGLDWFRYSKIIRAEKGQHGGSSCQKGRDGQDFLIKVPPGTCVFDSESGDLLYDAITPHQEFLLCQGGNGGFGNKRFRTSTNRAPNKANPGQKGQTRSVRLELKLIADIGLVGFPNAGKSTLFSRLTNNNVEIGAYPFTTLSPNIGFIPYPLGQRVSITDIPGIIQGAHHNRGLGLQFLRHIERTKALLFILDASQDPAADFHTLQQELQAYDPSLLTRPFAIILNKCDLENPCTTHFTKDPFFEISAHTGQGIDQLPPFLQTLSEYS